MSPDEAKSRVINYWLEKADEAIEASRDDFVAKRFAFAVNRIYYACFYALSAVLLNEGEEFTKHTGVRSAFHRLLVKTGRVSPDLGRFYDRLFENRQRADYQELVEFEQEQVEELFYNTTLFISKMKDLLK